MAISELPPELVKLAMSLLGSPIAPQAPPAGARDLQSYTIHVGVGNDRASVQFDDLNVPEKLEPLLRHLMKASKPRPMR